SRRYAAKAALALSIPAQKRKPPAIRTHGASSALRLSMAMFSKPLVILPHWNCRAGLRLSFRSLARRSLPVPWSCNPSRSQKQQTRLGDGSKQTNANETCGKVRSLELRATPGLVHCWLLLCHWSHWHWFAYFHPPNVLAAFDYGMVCSFKGHANF